MTPADKPERHGPRGRARKRRAGLPAKDSVLSEKTFTSPKGNAYRILKTTEKDAYEERRKRKRRD